MKGSQRTEQFSMGYEKKKSIYWNTIFILNRRSCHFPSIPKSSFPTSLSKHAVFLTNLGNHPDLLDDALWNMDTIHWDQLTEF